MYLRLGLSRHPQCFECRYLGFFEIHVMQLINHRLAFEG